MILLFDVGNTTIDTAIYDGKHFIKKFKLNTNIAKTPDEYYLDIKRLLDGNIINDIVISSVVPAITNILNELTLKFFKISPIIIQPKVKTGIKIITDNPKEVGADIICAASGVIDRNESCLIIDLGTATKYIYVRKNSIIGVIITPGIEISIRALVGNTALLPEIDIEQPKKVLGTNTIECMQSGVTYGVAVQIDGLIDLIKKEVKEYFDVIITGGLSNKITTLVNHSIIIDDNIIFKGMINIYKKNKKGELKDV